MKLELLDAKAYEKICDTGQYFYNSKNFIELNKGKAEEVIYALFKEKITITNWYKNQTFLMLFFSFLVCLNNKKIYGKRNKDFRY